MTFPIIGPGVIICGVNKGTEKKYRCFGCGYESDRLDDFGTSLCWQCVFGAVEDEPNGPDLESESLTREPCPECGAAGACGYDTNGRPMIHAVHVCRVCGETACGGACEHLESLAASDYDGDDE